MLWNLMSKLASAVATFYEKVSSFSRDVLKAVVNLSVPSFTLSADFDTKLKLTLWVWIFLSIFHTVVNVFEAVPKVLGKVELTTS